MNKGFIYTSSGGTTLDHLNYYSRNQVGHVKGFTRKSRIGSNLSIILTEPPAVINSTTTYSSWNRVTSYECDGFTYDANGHMASWGLNNTTYQWQATGRLSSVVSNDPYVSFFYDAFGRRVQKNVAGVKTAYLYDGEDVVQTQHDGVVNNVLYVHGPGIDEPLARIEADGTVRYYHADAQGTVLSLVDETGAIRTRYRYTVYGAPTVVGEASGNPYMYTGREYDFETGLYFFRNRYQSPILSRFISEDPIGVQAGLNFYAYVNGNPVNYIDPWGLHPPQNVPINYDLCRIKSSIQSAKNMSNAEFFDAFKVGGEWDIFTQEGSQFGNFGNYFYGMMGRAAGYDSSTLLVVAGAVESSRGNSTNESFGTPFIGYPYGDKPRDQYWINQGMSDFDSGMYNYLFNSCQEVDPCKK